MIRALYGFSARSADESYLNLHKIGEKVKGFLWSAAIYRRFAFAIGRAVRG